MQLEGDVVLRRLGGSPKPTLMFIGTVLNEKRFIPGHYFTNLWFKNLCDVSLQIVIVFGVVNFRQSLCTKTIVTLPYEFQKYYGTSRFPTA